jgi:hypothetical protein
MSFIIELNWGSFGLSKVSKASNKEFSLALILGLMPLILILILIPILTLIFTLMFVFLLPKVGNCVRD